MIGEAIPIKKVTKYNKKFGAFFLFIAGIQKHANNITKSRKIMAKLIKESFAKDGWFAALKLIMVKARAPE